jgi:hypothetical protein
MTRRTWAAGWLAAVAGLAGAGGAAADVIHLVGGGAIRVEAWRDAGDAVEFASGGGIVRIAKSEIARIEGQTTRADLRMYSAPAAASAAGPTDGQAAARAMADLLGEGAAVFERTDVSAREKATALRGLGQRWRDLAVPAPLGELHARGQRTLQVALEAYAAEDEGTAPDARERVEAARAGLREALAETRRAAGQPG